MDFDKSGQITEDEWMAFWEIVKKSGYTDREISEEVMGSVFEAVARQLDGREGVGAIS